MIKVYARYALNLPNHYICFYIPCDQKDYIKMQQATRAFSQSLMPITILSGNFLGLSPFNSLISRNWYVIYTLSYFELMCKTEKNKFDQVLFIFNIM